MTRAPRSPSSTARPTPGPSSATTTSSRSPHTRGQVQLWSQDRRYEWVNEQGGYGYLRRGDGSVVSTLYADRPAGARTRRDFGTGYFGRLTAVRGVAIGERVYAPFGDDPLLLHDVTIRNTADRPLRADWFEYWGVSPRSVVGPREIGVARPAYRRAGARCPRPSCRTPSTRAR